jgi:hypothetical protein
MNIAQLLHELRVISNVEIVGPLLPEMLFPTQAKSGLEWATRRPPVNTCVIRCPTKKPSFHEELPVVVTRKIYEANVLFGVAVNSAASIKAPARAGGQLQALVSVVFSVVAVEAFLNEAAEMALDFSDLPSEPQVVSAFGECMVDAEKSRASLESKFALANWVLVGKKLDKGAQPYQDFALIVRLRNDLVHFKGNERFEQNVTAEEFHKSLIQRFGNKDLLAEDMEPGSWIHAIETKAIADWSCRNAAHVIVDFVSKTPQGAWRSFLEGIHRHFVPYAT